jgi:tetratricopeptide (TPR) repeat protein
MSDNLAAGKRQLTVHIEARDFASARLLGEQLCRTYPDDPELSFLVGAICGQSSDWVAAERFCLMALAHAPSHPVLRYNLGTALLRQGKAQASIEHFLAAIAGQPAFAEAAMMLGHAYKHAERWAEAGYAYYRVAQLKPDSFEPWPEIGYVMRRSYRFDTLIEWMKSAAERWPNEISIHLCLAQAYTESAELESALASYQRVLAISPGEIEAVAGVASIYYAQGRHRAAFDQMHPLIEQFSDNPSLVLTYGYVAPKFGESERAAALLQRQLTRTDLDGQARGRLAIALGKLYERLGDYDAAFAEFERGNRLYGPKFDRVSHEEEMCRFEEVYSPSAVPGMPTSGCESERPIFVVGMPRSGTSLVEQILASHPQVYGAGELKYLNVYRFELSQHLGGKYPHGMVSADPMLLRAKADHYLSELDKLSNTAARVTDKMPINFIHLGLIYQLFPKARVIHCVRDPVDTCLSCYTQFFSGAYLFSYDLADLGFYYRSYVRLMTHWRKVLPIRILDVSYESLVENPETVTRQMLEHCGLEWDPCCLEFHNTRRTVLTASTDQVRQPMYRDSVGRWRYYEKHLRPLLEPLGIKSPHTG